jgi:hypothetical protein
MVMSKTKSKATFDLKTDYQLLQFWWVGDSLCRATYSIEASYAGRKAFSAG